MIDMKIVQADALRIAREWDPKHTHAAEVSNVRTRETLAGLVGVADVRQPSGSRSVLSWPIMADGRAVVRHLPHGENPKLRHLDLCTTCQDPHCPGWNDPSTCQQLRRMTPREWMEANPDLAEHALAQWRAEGKDLDEPLHPTPTEP